MNDAVAILVRVLYYSGEVEERPKLLSPAHAARYVSRLRRHRCVARAEVVLPEPRRPVRPQAFVPYFPTLELEATR